MSHCPKCQGPEVPDIKSAIDSIGAKIRYTCLLCGRDRWESLVEVQVIPFGKYHVANRMYPPIDCERCGFPIEPRLALNQKRHGRCAALETQERKARDRREAAKLARARRQRRGTTRSESEAAEDMGEAGSSLTALARSR